MVKTSIERLTARHRDCLQLVAMNHSTKEIAKKLSLSPNTVDGYISDAREILGASSRRDAARIFRTFSDEKSPQSLRGDFSRVSSSYDSRSTLLGGPKNDLRDAASPQDDSFQWFRGKREHNTLSSPQRIMWIAAASVAASFIFLSALNIIDTLARLLSH
jgi:DNA-binding CsgD family transcriptional regulator